MISIANSKYRDSVEIPFWWTLRRALMGMNCNYEILVPRSQLEIKVWASICRLPGTARRKLVGLIAVNHLINQSIKIWADNNHSLLLEPPMTHNGYNESLSCTGANVPREHENVKISEPRRSRNNRLHRLRCDPAKRWSSHCLSPTTRLRSRWL
jgi:hypothetical protein